MIMRRLRKLREKFDNDALLYFIVGMIGTLVVVLFGIGYNILF